MTGLDPVRAPVIVAGLVMLHTILERYGLESIEVSERDLLEGAALAAAELPEPAEGPVPPTAFTCCSRPRRRPCPCTYPYGLEPSQRR